MARGTKKKRSKKSKESKEGSESERREESEKHADNASSLNWATEVEEESQAQAAEARTETVKEDATEVKDTGPDIVSTNTNMVDIVKEIERKMGAAEATDFLRGMIQQWEDKHVSEAKVARPSGKDPKDQMPDEKEKGIF